MNFQHLKYLLAVLQEGSLSRAARTLHMAQPTLSQHIKALEHTVGATLLDRSPTGVTSTPAGEILAEHARHILDSVERARKDVVSSGPSVRGEVTLAIPRMVSAEMSPPLLRLIRHHYPDVTLRIREGNTLFCSELTANARVDLGILPADHGTARIQSRPLLEHPIYLVGAVDNSFGVVPTDAPIRFAEAAGYPLTAIRKPHSLRLELDQLAARHDVSLNIIVESDTGAVNRHYVTGGAAISFLPLLSFHEKLATGQVFARPVVEPRLTRRYVLCWPTTRPMNRATDVVCELIEKVAGSETAAGRPTPPSSPPTPQAPPPTPPPAPR